ncbi:helix-turn-helix domain-containing protein [Tardiphaga sp. vice304]|uniref:helix-turn-helix domain-containing protein n=1 Tax=Tardiphaga sp. vice304 TaxID=2592817 RepID=UPI001FEE1010|nr:helix-turn-helix domain-containing protein [Tardiphaga sp. vice304]
MSRYTEEFDHLLMEATAAKRLKVSPRTLQNWRIKGVGPSYIRAGRMIRYRSKDLTIWLTANTVSSAASAIRAA